MPACTACERSGKGSSCSGANDEFAKGKERSYVAALEAASERLQRKITETRSFSSPTAAPGSFAGSPFLGSTLGQSVPLQRPAGGRARRKEASDVDDLVGDFGFLSVNATSRDFHGFTSTMSFARLLLSVSMVGDLPSFNGNPLPPRHVAAPLIQYYLDNIFVLMPFLSETELMSSVSSVYQDSGRHAKSSHHWTVHMVLAIAAGATSQNRGDSNHQTALRHLVAALNHAEAVLHPGAISGVQGILLLAQYSLIDPVHFRTWDLIGMASRVMVDLGLHVELSPETKITKDNLDMRRRVFYCVYALDRNISMAYGRAFTFTDDSACVFLPLLPGSARPSDLEKDTAPQMFLRSLKPSLYLFDIRRVQSAFYQTTQCSSRVPWSSSTASEYVDCILSDIRSWFATIPTSLSQRHKVFFSLESLYSQIVALGPSCRIPASNMTDISKTLIFEYTLQYADQLQPVIQDTSWHAFLTFVDLLRVNSVGRLFREAMWSNFDQLLSGGVSHSPVSSPKTEETHQFPTFPQITSPLENCVRAIKCLDTIIEVLEYARQRWGLDHLREKFVQESAMLMGKLRNKRQELDMSQGLMTDFSHPPQQSLQNSVTDPGTREHVQRSNSQPPYPLLHHQPAMQVSHEDMFQQPPQFMRSASHGVERDASGMYGLPEGSLPRRGYEFLGGQRPERRNNEAPPRG